MIKGQGIAGGETKVHLAVIVVVENGDTGAVGGRELLDRGHSGVNDQIDAGAGTNICEPKWAALSCRLSRD